MIKLNSGCFKKGDIRLIGNTFGFKKGHQTWNKGLTKETDERIRKYSEKLKKWKEENIKGKTYEEIYGKEKAEKIKNNYKITRSLDKNSRWLGGKSFENYGFEFNDKLKNQIRKRDNQICMNCGIHREKLKEALTIHHINYDKKLTILENLISLCRNCHLLTNINREYWTKLFQEKLNKTYNYQYSENGEIKINICNGLI